MAAPSLHHQAKFALGDTLPVDLPLEFSTENLRKVPIVDAPPGLRGTRSDHDDRASDGTYTVSGSITLPGPSPTELDSILKYVTGSAKSGNDFALAETLAEFYAVKDLKAKVATYAGCKVSRATFRSSQGGFLEVTLDIEGKTETIGNAGTFPSLTLDTGKPYRHHHLALTIGGAAKECIDFTLVVDHRLMGDKFRNSQTRSQIPEGKRVVTCTVTAPFSSDETALYATSSVAVVAAWTLGNRSLTATLPAVRFAPETPSVGGEEITLALPGVARRTSGALELTFTNDVTG